MCIRDRCVPGGDAGVRVSHATADPASEARSLPPRGHRAGKSLRPEGRQAASQNVWKRMCPSKFWRVVRKILPQKVQFRFFQRNVPIGWSIPAGVFAQIKCSPCERVTGGAFFCFRIQKTNPPAFTSERIWMAEMEWCQIYPRGKTSYYFTFIILIYRQSSFKKTQPLRLYFGY